MRIIRIQMSYQPLRKPEFYGEPESRKIRLRVEVYLYWLCLDLQQCGWHGTHGTTQTSINVTTIISRSINLNKYCYCLQK